MLSTLPLVLLPVSLAHLALPSVSLPSVSLRSGPAPWPAQREGFDERFSRAKGDLEQLWDLWLWCEAGDHAREGKKVLRAILDLNPSYRPAREALGHEFYDGRWFETRKELERYQRTEEERRAQEQGLVRWKGEWVSSRDLPFLERGLVRDGSGGWVTLEEQRKLAEGWVRQDLHWVPPEDAPKVAQGLWLCGEQWLDTAQADAYHVDFDRCWRVPSAGFLLLSTCARATLDSMAPHLEHAGRDLERIFGVTPSSQPKIVMLSSPRQYERWGKGQIPAGAVPPDSRGLNLVHLAFFADRALDPTDASPLRCGAGYWDATSESGERFGRHSLRHAAGLSWAAALEARSSAPSASKSKRKRAAQPVESGLPDWFRYGAAAYVERSFVDNYTAAGGDPYWARAWSKQNLARAGGPLPLGDFFAFRPDPAAHELSGRWINQAGAVIAFVLETELKDVRTAHARVKDAFASGQGIGEALEALRTTVLAHADRARAHASE